MSNLIEKLNETMAYNDKVCLIRAWNILKDISDDLYSENLEDTDEYFHATSSYKILGLFLDDADILYEEVETNISVNIIDN